jgi:hypothetical protein
MMGINTGLSSREARLANGWGRICKMHFFIPNDSQHQHLKQLFTLGTASRQNRGSFHSVRPHHAATGKALNPAGNAWTAATTTSAMMSAFLTPAVPLKIKSKRQPCLDVLEASGQPCLYRQQKTGPSLESPA